MALETAHGPPRTRASPLVAAEGRKGTSDARRETSSTSMPARGRPSAVGGSGAGSTGASEEGGSPAPVAAPPAVLAAGASSTLTGSAPPMSSAAMADAAADAAAASSPASSAFVPSSAAAAEGVIGSPEAPASPSARGVVGAALDVSPRAARPCPQPRRRRPVLCLPASSAPRAREAGEAGVPLVPSVSTAPMPESPS